MIAISLLETDILDLKSEVDRAVIAGADMFYMEFGDCSFKAKAGLGAVICQSLRDHGVTSPIAVNLNGIVTREAVLSFSKSGVNYISFEMNAPNRKELICLAKSLGCRAGLRVNSVTDDLCFEAVNFLIFENCSSSLGSGNELIGLINSIQARNSHEEYDHIEIFWSGSISDSVYKKLKSVGVDVFIAGKKDFVESDYYTLISRLRKNDTPLQTS